MRWRGGVIDQNRVQERNKEGKYLRETIFIREIVLTMKELNYIVLSHNKIQLRLLQLFISGSGMIQSHWPNAYLSHKQALVSTC